MQEEFKKDITCSEPHSQNRLCEALLLLMMALNSNKKAVPFRKLPSIILLCN